MKWEEEEGGYVDRRRWGQNKGPSMNQWILIFSRLVVFDCSPRTLPARRSRLRPLLRGPSRVLLGMEDSGITHGTPRLPKRLLLDLVRLSELPYLSPFAAVAHPPLSLLPSLL
jgi:hypothetical protein